MAPAQFLREQTIKAKAPIHSAFRERVGDADLFRWIDGALPVFAQ